MYACTYETVLKHSVEKCMIREISRLATLRGVNKITYIHTIDFTNFAKLYQLHYVMRLDFCCRKLRL